MKKLVTLSLTLALMSSMAVTASAADYSFKTEAVTDYYKSTCYEDLYDARYDYGSTNRIDYDIPAVKYGLAGENRDDPSGIRYGLSNACPELTYGAAEVFGADPIEIEYRPAVTAADLKQKDGSIGTVSISRVGLSAKVYEGATDASMSKGAGHYTGTAVWDGNVALFGHNRGSHAYFGTLKDVRVGDTVKYTTALGTKTYEVLFTGTIASTDYSYLNEMGDDRVTLITCIANQPSLRLCVQAVEV